MMTQQQPQQQQPQQQQTKVIVEKLTTPPSIQSWGRILFFKSDLSLILSQQVKLCKQHLPYKLLKE